MATTSFQVYRCEVCGNMVHVVHPAGGTLTCCDQPMTHLDENTTDAAKEKHVPVVEKVEGGIKITVGSVAHPMEAEHYIEWIEMIAGDIVGRKHLKPGDPPEAMFPCQHDDITVRAYCNLHGLWKA